MKENTDKTVREIADLLERSPSSIHHFCDRNNISLKKDYVELTEQEMNFIEKEKDNLSIEIICNLLNRTSRKIVEYINLLDS